MQLPRVAQSLGRLAAAGCRVSRGAAADPRAAPMHSCNSKVAAALEEFRRCAYWNLREHSGLLRHGEARAAGAPYPGPGLAPTV